MKKNRLNWCWWRILETECPEFSLSLLMTFLVIFATNIPEFKRRAGWHDSYFVTNLNHIIWFKKSVSLKQNRPIWWHLWQFFGAIYMNYIMISSKRSMMNVIDFQSFWSVIRTFHICFSKTTNASIQYQSIQSNHSHTLLRTAWYPNSSSPKFTPHKENVTKKRHQKPPSKPFLFVWKLDFSNYFSKLFFPI